METLRRIWNAVRRLWNHARWLYEYVRRGEPELILGHFRSEPERKREWAILLNRKSEEIGTLLPTLRDIDTKIRSFDRRNGTNFGLVFREQLLNRAEAPENGFGNAVRIICWRAEKAGAIDAERINQDMIADILNVRHFRF